ncbi:MAG: hypothetical protein KJN67_03095 [Pontiella sp.]|nr:hypothetical protein [Pontiella sp.]
MAEDNNRKNHDFKPIEDQILHAALTELGRMINIVTTYGEQHPAVQKAAETTRNALNALFAERKKVIIGAFNGALTIDEVTVAANGTLLKSLERRLTRLRITGLKIARGISDEELMQLAELLSCKEPDQFQEAMGQAGLSHITAEDMSYQAVHSDQTVANTSELAGMGGEGVLVLDDDMAEDGGSGSGEKSDSGGESNVHVEQIVAFLKGDIELEDDASIGEELSEIASDPARLGKMIMESVAVRQSVSELSGESLGDIVLGCLRRTFNGLRKQPAFQSTEGKADLQKALLLLEENILDKMRDLSGDTDSELDRQIVQTIREMDESLGFESAAMEYMQHHDALDDNKQMMEAYVKAHGPASAGELLSDTDFPPSDWRRIVVESKQAAAAAESPPVASGLGSLVNVFDKIEQLMKASDSDGGEVKHLLDEANHNLDDTAFHAKEKLEILSEQLHGKGIGTIGGQGLYMDQAELLESLAEAAQELMQPLTAINASLEMMLQGYVGEFSEEQQDLLNLASNSGEHLKFLMREMIDIVGCPVNKGVDDRFHMTSEEVMLKKAS